MSSSNYEELLKKFQLLQKEFDDTKQELYNSTRRIQAAQAMEAEYNEALKVLEKRENGEIQRLCEKIQQLEDSNLQLKTSYSARVQDLEKQLDNKENEVKTIQKTLDDKLKNSKTQIVEEKNEEEIAHLKDIIENLLSEMHNLEIMGRDNEENKLQFETTTKQLNEELSNYRENLAFIRKELEDVKVVNQTLKDENIYLQSELNSIKCQPLDEKSQGNSLFAEVNDRRIKLQENLNNLKKKYAEVKLDRANFMKENMTLRNENLILIKNWKKEQEQEKLDLFVIEESYKSQIKVQTEIIEDYKKKLEEKWENTGNDVFLFCDSMIKRKNKEIEMLKEKLLSKALNQSMLSTDLAEAHRDIRRLKLQIGELENEVSSLKLEIKELKNNTPTETTVENSTDKFNSPEIPKSILKGLTSEENIIMKEQQNEMRKVCFPNEVVTGDENSAKTNITKRKGAKIHISKRIEISSITTSKDNI